MSENKCNENAVAVQEKGALVEQGAFGMTFEQAEKNIENSLRMYRLATVVIKKLLDEKKDMYYMSELGGGKGKKKKERNPDELPVINKQGTDKLISFFKIETVPTESKIDGGYKVTVVGRDRHGNYIAAGTGICTKYEKKYMWIKADDEEYKEANAEDRREVKRKGQYGDYKIKQIRTDERSIGHTLVSMATKRARAAFLRMALPGLNDVSFEGEEPQVNYGSDEPVKNQMKDDEITAFIDGLYEKGYEKKQVEEAFIAIKGDKKPKGMNLDLKDAIETHLKDNYGKDGGGNA